MNNLSEEEIIKQVEAIIIRIRTSQEITITKNDDTAIQGLLDLYNKEKLNRFILSEQLDKEKEKNIPLIIDGKSINAYADEIEDLLSIEDGTPVYFSIGERQAIKIISQYCRNSIPKDKIKAKIEEVKDGTFDAKIVLQSLLEKE